MDLRSPLALLGGLAPAAFMRDVWQKKPLLIRAALPLEGVGGLPLAPVTPRELLALALRDDVESRLVTRDGRGARGGRAGPARWSLRRGPFARRDLPPWSTPGWTLLVQGVDLHVDAAHDLLQRFRWISDARLDDLMVSYASPGGGVGPHVDSYDVFLLQVSGSRRWRVGPVAQPAFVADLPLRILSAFEPVDEWVLEPGDMLYLPPGWGHDGVAEEACMTCSIGYRAPGSAALARDLLQRLGEEPETEASDALYRDPPRSATAEPGRMPPALAAFARRAVARALRDPAALEQTLGEAMTEPKANVWFDRGAPRDHAAGLRLDRRTRMMYDDRFVFINGEALRAAGRDATLMRELADARRLAAPRCARLSPAARAVVSEWVEQGWAHDD